LKINLKKKLNNIPEITAWQYNINEEKSSQIYLIKDKIEAFRETNTEQVEVIIYRELEDEKMGEASFYFTPVEEFQIDEKIERALYIAGLTGQKPFKIAGPVYYPPLPLLDRKVAKNPQILLKEFRERIIKAVKNEGDIELSSSECYVSNKTTEFKNSRGARGKMIKSRISWDFVLLAGDKLESESWYESSCCNYKNLNIEEKIKEYSKYARDNVKTKLPETLNTAIIVNAKALSPFFEPFMAHSSGKFIYEKVSSFKKGEPVYRGKTLKGEPLTLKSNPLIPYGLASFPFDKDGVEGKTVEIIKNSNMENIWSNKRYSFYLNIPPTGMPGNLEINTGKASMEELLQTRDKPVYHIIKFSLLFPDTASGDFATEIRFGYEINAKGEKIPIKGGSVSGNVFEMFGNARFCNERVMEKSYFGPRAIRFENISISGS